MSAEEHSHLFDSYGTIGSLVHPFVSGAINIIVTVMIGNAIGDWQDILRMQVESIDE